MTFGISTHLYHEQKLQREHVLEVAARGFEAMELFATRSHFDYHDPAAIRGLSEWVSDAGLRLNSVHAPITDVFANGRGQRSFSTATRDTDARQATMREMAAALAIAKVIPLKFLVVHLGVPDAASPPAEENNREAAIRSIEEIHALAEPLGVRLALEVMGNALSTAPALVELIERTFDGSDIGICMDVGHAHLLGDVSDAIETASGYLLTTHIHDNRRKSDDHLSPFQGSIDWPSTIMAFEKIGYDGVLMYEMQAAEGVAGVLERGVAARRRLEALRIDGSQFL